ncbi:MAG: hypothetical protein PHY82_03465 [Lentisphaeria bacterium]|nr:hypothetical protein [Lentisphaeria bacterium]
MQAAQASAAQASVAQASAAQASVAQVQAAQVQAALLQAAQASAVRAWEVWVSVELQIGVPIASSPSSAEEAFLESTVRTQKEPQPQPHEEQD